MSGLGLVCWLPNILRAKNFENGHMSTIAFFAETTVMVWVQRRTKLKKQGPFRGKLILIDLRMLKLCGT